jgi:hypothetical protein
MSLPPIIGRWRYAAHEVVAAAATSRTIESPEVPREKIRHIERVNLYNKDTGGSVCVISVMEADERLEVYGQTLTSAATWYPIKLHLNLFPGERLEYAFSTCTAADDLYIREFGETHPWGRPGEWATVNGIQTSVEGPEGVG